jgi:hypothetical protein
VPSLVAQLEQELALRSVALRLGGMERQSERWLVARWVR